MPNYGLTTDKGVDIAGKCGCDGCAVKDLCMEGRACKEYAEWLTKRPGKPFYTPLLPKPTKQQYKKLFGEAA